MRSAAVLADEAGFVRAPPPPGREYTLEDRRAIAGYFLRLYCATRRSDAERDRTEYIWLDEFCLSDDSLAQDKHALEAQRNVELGRLPDIFGSAAQTVVFCHEEGCDHTRLTCIWGQRLFTIPEILHAQTVLRLTRRREGDVLNAYILPTSGRDFRKAMQLDAAKNNKWHLYAIFQHTVNAGAVPWQVAIHALVVEAIRRDEAGGFLEHKFLGKALNGLLPRRARLQDLGNSGWADLSWLLELNQGFYNAVSLASVCSIAEGDSASWLGKPIDPTAGNERLEPVATAFPISTSETETDPVLAIIGAETLGLRQKRLKRDAWGLYNNKEMRNLKILAQAIAASLVIISIGVLIAGVVQAGIALYVLTSVFYCILELLVGTMYLDRNGWVFLEDEVWGDELESKLGEQDNNLRKLTYWGVSSLRGHSIS
ncbi:hypothetical protein GGX14DRAFT_374710 [Mycena pura]|uniref:Heterokaryon incompatibility domain-containing protein n=1 Tax=Mycena pura TaxID=153505 RepID=A0AAD6V210_9AGAR|nr:hypothetical protein GGX14DRAFT_374710 [Mycena pura]